MSWYRLGRIALCANKSRGPVHPTTILLSRRLQSTQNATNSTTVKLNGKQKVAMSTSSLLAVALSAPVAYWLYSITRRETPSWYAELVGDWAAILDGKVVTLSFNRYNMAKVTEFDNSSDQLSAKASTKTIAKGPTLWHAREGTQWQVDVEPMVPFSSEMPYSIRVMGQPQTSPSGKAKLLIVDGKTFRKVDKASLA